MVLCREIPSQLPACIYLRLLRIICVHVYTKNTCMASQFSVLSSNHKLTLSMFCLSTYVYVSSWNSSLPENGWSLQRSCDPGESIVYTSERRSSQTGGCCVVMGMVYFLDSPLNVLGHTCIAIIWIYFRGGHFYGLHSSTCQCGIWTVQHWPRPLDYV